MNNFPINILVYTFTYNNQDILPYVIDYWKLYASKVIVYDNESTDNTVNILKQYDWIEIRTYSTDDTYDPDTILAIKNSCYKEAMGKVDYVMICDIDEVLYYGNRLLDILSDLKKQGIQIVNTKYYSLVSNRIPDYNNTLLQKYIEMRYYKEEKDSIFIFDPACNINFIDYSLNANKLSYTISKERLYILHFKYIGLNRVKAKYTLYSSRYKGTNIEYVLGAKSLILCIRNYNNYQLGGLHHNICINFDDKLSSMKTTFTEDNTVKEVQTSLKKIAWTPTSIEYNTKTNNMDCCIAIPVYKTELNNMEWQSLKQVVEILSAKYDIVLFGPESLDFDFLSKSIDYKFNVLKCNEKYFKSISTYSTLCETKAFYESFKDYKFLMIYQLDGWIFRDQLSKYIALDYDYIGGPWKAGCNKIIAKESVGNGGVSLRKVLTFIDICGKLTDDDLASKYAGLEDIFFCIYIKDKYRYSFEIAPVEAAYQFCIDENPEYWYSRNNNKLPMCVHRIDNSFWKTYVNLEEPEKIVVTEVKDVKKVDDVKKVEKPAVVEQVKEAVNLQYEDNLLEKKEDIIDYIHFICEDEYGNMPTPCYNYDDLIIVTMTSWTKRINNVKTSCECILANTLLPAKMVINLAIEEFPNKESDLPKDLIEYIKLHNIIEINWVKHNTKVWKKSIPTLMKYPNALVLCIDDDFKYPTDFIKTFSDKHKELPDVPLAGTQWKIYGDYNLHCGCSTLDSLKLLKSFIKLLDKEIYDLGDEDTFMTYCYKCANIHVLYVGKQFFTNMPCILSNNPYSGSRTNTTKYVWKIISTKYDNKNLIEYLHDYYISKFNNNVLICIFNYKHDDNAKKWLHLLSPYFKTIVLDSGNDHKELEFMQFENIYYSGLWNEMKNIVNDGSYNWVGVITSDVTISSMYEHTLIDKINWLSITKNVGQYLPSLDLSSADGNHKQQVGKGIIAVDFIEGMFSIMNRKIFDMIPYIDTTENLYGMYIDNVVSALCIYNNLYNIYDNTYTIHHPGDSGYSKENRKAYILWCTKIKELLIGKKLSINNKELGFSQIDNPIIEYKPYITSTISYNGKKEHPVFVSFTTWKKRLPYLEKYVNNLIKQNYDVDKYIMWISTDEIDVSEIPDSIKKIPNLEIHYVDKNLKSFKKFLTILQYPNAYNIIVDDDRLYYKNIVNDLINTASKNDDNSIICYYTDICNSKGLPWGGVQGNDITQYKWVNDSCILYLPNTFPQEIFDIFMDVMKNEKLVSDECLIMPFLIYYESKIISICNNMQGLNKVARLMETSNNKDALHNMFFKTAGRVDDNMKNDLIRRIVSRLNPDILHAFCTTFKNFKL